MPFSLPLKYFFGTTINFSLIKATMITFVLEKLLQIYKSELEWQKAF